jgi:hypothetical protein
VLDRHWNVVMSNGAAHGLTALLPPALAVPPLNIFRVSLHPQGMAAHTSNFAEWGSYMLDALHRSVLSSGDALLRELEREVRAYPNVAPLLDRAEAEAQSPVPALLVPCVLQLPAGTLSMFTTLTTFGTARDVTLDELSVEMFYPSDAASEALLRMASASSSVSAVAGSTCTRCVARSICTRASWSAAFSALVMVLTQWPQVMSFTSKAIIALSTGWGCRGAYCPACHCGKVKPCIAKTPSI